LRTSVAINRIDEFSAVKQTFDASKLSFGVDIPGGRTDAYSRRQRIMKSFLWALFAAPTVLCANLSKAGDLSAEQTSVVEGKQPAIKRTVLRRADVPGTHYEVVYALVKIAPHSVVDRHTHPGTVFGYLMRGDYTILINGSPHLIRTGETWEVPGGVVHEEHTGERGAEILAVFTVEKGKPLTSAAN
jgi:quercetin dioxygenase-like cupin family protein